jgi:hypothetical protein
MYYVYLHTFPNGKVYVGEARNPIKRWRNGEGYTNNKEITKAIQEYGWDNIKHEIVAEFNHEKDAVLYEAVLICLLDSEASGCGYNMTHIKKNALNLYSSRVDADSYQFEKPKRSKNVLEASGLPISTCRQLIDEWIFNKKHREIITDRFIDGLSNQETANKYGMSERQIQNIIDSCIVVLNEHINE